MNIAGKFPLWGRHSAFGLVVAALVFALDQGSKFYLLDVVDIASRGYIEAGPFLDIVMAWNEGISYGLFQTGGAGRWVLAALQIAAGLGLTVWLARVKGGFLSLALGLVIGGAFGNALDRVRFGAVADFFLLHLRALGLPITWYVFNLADVAIVAGIGLLMYDTFLVQRPAPKCTDGGPQKSE